MKRKIETLQENTSKKSKSTSIIDIGYQFKCLSNQLGYTQVQKLCYYAYGFHYAIYSEHLFREDFTKHDHGPYNVELNEEMHVYDPTRVPKMEEILATVQLTYDILGNHTYGVLESISHVRIEPWKDSRLKKWDVISKISIETYFVQEKLLINLIFLFW
jgi:uncharacterized phage-associated protein